MFKYSPETDLIYPNSMLNRYPSLPGDLVGITEAEANIHNGNTPPPEGKRRIKHAYPFAFEDIPPKTEEELNSYKEEKKDSLIVSCRASIESLIPSSSLGAKNTYSCRIIDQHNLTMIVLAGMGGDIHTHDGTEFSWVTHSHEQCVELLKDMNSHIKEKRDRLHSLVSQVNAASSEEEVDSISW